MKRPGTKNVLAALALAGLSAGCVTVFPDAAPAPQIFRLDAPAWTFENAPRVDWTISVARPSAPRTLSGADLVLREGENRVAYVSGSEWAEPMPGLLQRTLTAALDRSGKIIAVTPEAGARSDCELQWDLYAFDVAQNGGRFSARFEAGVRLIEGRRRMIMQSTRISTTGEVDGENARAAAAALTKAALEGVNQASVWALSQHCVRLARPGADAPEAPLAGAPPAPMIVPVPSVIPAPAPR